MPITAKSVKKMLGKPIAGALEAMGFKKDYSYYQNYLRNIGSMERFEINNTEYLNAKKRMAKGQPNYLNYLRQTKRNNRPTKTYEAWKKAKDILAAPVEYTENPMRRSLPSGTTLASNPAAGAVADSRPPSPVANSAEVNLTAEGGKRYGRTRRLRRSKKHSRRHRRR
jgi:uncharacterized short protein YbdD (DUF466 family)